VGVEIVVLSACDLGRGRDADAEGMLNLARGFLTAGAEVVIASLWPVDDAAVVEAMTELHLLLVEGAEPVAAVRRWQGDRWVRDGLLGPSVSFEVFGYR
jgi:CHAT domain-containing protein